MLRNVLASAIKQSYKANTNATVFRALSAGGSKTTTGSSVDANQPHKQQEEFCPPINVNVIDYEDPDYLPVPEYPARPNEPLATRKSRLLYQSRKRGMLENDLLLSTFAARYLQSFDADQTAQYDQLINGVSNDWDIYYWATDTKPVPEQYDTPVFRLLKQHVSNVEKEPRLRQPDVFGNEV